MLVRDDFKTHLYPELIDAIERDDDTKLETAIRASELLAKGYMSRFDKPALFTAEGEARDEFLLMILKDLTVWNFIIIANPNISIEFHRERYEDAIKTLEKIQSGKVVPDGWPPATTPENADTFFHVSSNPRRGTSY
jgi:hypothetical protein